MGKRELKIGYESALDFWRGARAASGAQQILEEGGHVYGAAAMSLRELARRALTLCGSEPPLDVALPCGAARHGCDLIVDHVWRGPLGQEHVLALGDGISVCRMPVVISQLGGSLSEIELARLSYEMSGTYGLAPWTDKGKVQDVSALVDPAEIKGYATAARALGARGAARATFMSDLVVSGSNSPRETDIAIVLMLSRRKGGFYLGGFKMNYRIQVPARLRGLAGQNVLIPDFCWPNAMIIIEYDSNEAHTTPEAKARDERRRKAFEAMGYTVRVLTNDVLRSSMRLDAFMDDIARLLGRARRPASDEILASRRQLRNELFGPELIDEALRHLHEFPEE